VTGSRICAALPAARAGSFVLIADTDDGRACLLAASAERLTAHALNQMVTLGHSLLSVAVPLSDYARLGLPTIAPATASSRPVAAFCMVEATEGVTTGISVLDRLTTIRACTAGRVGALRQPGHVFIAPTVDAGVSGLAGPREAGCDLMGLAGLSPRSVLSPVIDSSGAPWLSGEAAAAAETLGVPLVRVADVLNARSDDRAIGFAA
jgi:3,4-dihydroxy 2-butanone 4-phosphate synthase/GTP cyclohydrolase II